MDKIENENTRPTDELPGDIRRRTKYLMRHIGGCMVCGNVIAHNLEKLKEDTPEALAEVNEEISRKCEVARRLLIDVQVSNFKRTL